MQPMSIPQVGSTNSTPQPVKEGVSRIIPIKVERGVGAFNQQQNRTPTNAPLTDGSVTINNLDELKSHQAQKNAEESIRGYSKPKVCEILKFHTYNYKLLFKLVPTMVSIFPELFQSLVLGTFWT